MKNILIMIALIIVLLISIYNLFYYITDTIGVHQKIYYFGYQIITLDSQFATVNYDNGELIILKKMSRNDVKVNEEIVFEQNGKQYINHIYQVFDEQDEMYITVKGKNNYYISEEKIPFHQITGKVITKLPWLGYILDFLQSKVLTILITIILFIIYLYINRKKIKSMMRRNKLQQKN